MHRYNSPIIVLISFSIDHSFYEEKNGYVFLAEPDSIFDPKLWISVASLPFDSLKNYKRDTEL